MIHRCFAHSLATIATIATIVATATPSLAGAPECSERSSLSQEDARCGYSYRFLDDPLAAGGLSAGDARVRGAHQPQRVLLIRPRAHFVVEMLKSVEDL